MIYGIHPLLVLRRTQIESLLDSTWATKSARRTWLASLMVSAKLTCRMHASSASPKDVPRHEAHAVWTEDQSRRDFDLLFGLSDRALSFSTGDSAAEKPSTSQQHTSHSLVTGTLQPMQIKLQAYPSGLSILVGNSSPRLETSSCATDQYHPAAEVVSLRSSSCHLPRYCHPQV